MKDSNTMVGGKGTLKYAFYKNGGVPAVRGLRNRRRAFWARQRQIEMIEKERKLKAEQARLGEDEDYGD